MPATFPSIRAAITCAALLPLALGCVSQGVHDLMTNERDDLERGRIQLEKKIEYLEATNSSLVAEREKLFDQFEDQRIEAGQLESDVRRLTVTGTELAENLEQTNVLLAQREAEIAAMRGTYDALVGDLQEEVAAGQIEIERLSSGVNLNLSQGVLFGIGSSEVSASGAAVLKKVAGRLSRISYEVEIIGHTDNVPIGVRYPSNWELAGARASSVVRLLAQGGVDPARLSAVSRGEYEPIAENDTAEGRAKNRRIEIRLTPAADGSVAEVDAEVGGEPVAAPVSDEVPAPDVETEPEVQPVAEAIQPDGSTPRP